MPAGGENRRELARHQVARDVGNGNGGHDVRDSMPPTAARRRSARCAARHAGMSAATTPTMSAAPICISSVSSETKNTGNSVPIALPNAVRDRKRQRDAERAAGQRDRDRFGEDEPGDEAVGKSDRLHRRIFGVAFARGHRHRVGHHRHDDDDDDPRDGLDGDENGLRHRDEPQLKRLFGFGERLRQRVLERRVDRAARSRRHRQGRESRPGNSRPGRRAAESASSRSRSDSPSGRRTGSRRPWRRAPS